MEKIPHALELVHKTTARMIEATTVPPRSQMEVAACVLGPVSEKTWLLEGIPTLTERSRKDIAIARSVVNPKSRTIPVRLLNYHDHPITIPKDALLATLESMDSDMEGICVEGGVSAQPWDEHELLWSMVEGAAEELDAGQKEQFFALLCKYSEIFAHTKSDIGRTGKLFIQVTQPQSNKESDECHILAGLKYISC